MPEHEENQRSWPMENHQPTSFTFVGRSFFQSTPTGIGGIHLTTGFRIGNFSFRGPVQNVCQCAERICGRGEACEPPRYSTEFDDDEHSRMNRDTRTPTSHTCGSRGARTDPDNVLRAEGCCIAGRSGSSEHRYRRSCNMAVKVALYSSLLPTYRIR